MSFPSLVCCSQTNLLMQNNHWLSGSYIASSVDGGGTCRKSLLRTAGISQALLVSASFYTECVLFALKLPPFVFMVCRLSSSTYNRSSFMMTLVLGWSCGMFVNRRFCRAFYYPLPMFHSVSCSTMLMPHKKLWGWIEGQIGYARDCMLTPWSSLEIGGKFTVKLFNV